MVRKNRCYLSGPITGIADYLERFDRYEYDLTQIFKWTVINPARVNHEMPHGTTYEEYMEMCETMLKMCDRIFLMQGWEESRGARFEREYAVIHGLEIWEENEAGEIHLTLTGGAK